MRSLKEDIAKLDNSPKAEESKESSGDSKEIDSTESDSSETLEDELRRAMLRYAISNEQIAPVDTLTSVVVDLDSSVSCIRSGTCVIL